MLGKRQKIQLNERVKKEQRRTNEVSARLGASLSAGAGISPYSYDYWLDLIYFRSLPEPERHPFSALRPSLIHILVVTILIFIVKHTFGRRCLVSYEYISL